MTPHMRETPLSLPAFLITPEAMGRRYWAVPDALLVPAREKSTAAADADAASEKAAAAIAAAAEAAAVAAKGKRVKDPEAKEKEAELAASVGTTTLFIPLTSAPGVWGFLGRVCT